MACNLKHIPAGGTNFVGSIGGSVTLKVTSPDASVNAKIVHVRYAGTGISQPPFQFTIKPNRNVLVAIVEASKPGAELELREDCGGGTDQVISGPFHFDPLNPGRTLFITGT
jgi:hypothetical protein